MLRVLFDKNVPYPLKRYLTECRVKTAEEEGWGQISNGELISCAAKANYDTLITCDQNVRCQQNLTHRKISMVVLGSNIWPSVRQKAAEIASALATASPGSSSSKSLHRRSGAGCRVRRSDAAPSGRC